VLEQDADKKPTLELIAQVLEQMKNVANACKKGTPAVLPLA
jgi:hypothetical protein